MSTLIRIYKNTFYMGSAEVIARALYFVIMLYAVRLLSKEHFGKFSFAIYLSLIAIMFVDLGINTLLIREVSRNKRFAGKYLINASFIKVVLSITIFLIVILFLNLLNYPNDTKQIVYIILFSTILLSFTELFYSMFIAFERMFYTAFLITLKITVLTLLSLFVLLKGYGLVAFSYTFVISELFIVLIAFLMCTKRLVKFERLKLIPEILFMKNIIKKTLPFGVAFIFGSIYFFSWAIFLSKTKGDADVAVYSTAYNIALALLFIPLAYTSALYPVMSRYYKKSKDMVISIYKKSFKYLYIIGLPISVGLYMVAERTITMLYGSNYSGSIISLKITSWFIFLKFINFLFGTVLHAIDKQNKRMISQVVIALFNILINIALIPKFGYVGAALSIIITEIALFMVYYYYVSKELYFYNFSTILIKPVIAAGIMALFIIFSNLGLIMEISFSILIYFCVLFALRTFDKEDVDIIKKISEYSKIGRANGNFKI